ncbi:homeobox-containing protein 1 [Plakobranchus ocellatus]|uniref:Homeobox-containing protein 1 n=1 Tax=Plakobranchus ocellatus TaxID=259542 RepID=A0AAV3ZHU4_9GAST|nr:homeobox-containing protein 1 [Plakobranchus ocellatus]
MQMSSNSFSVEQVELIRRLRNSGVTCQQLIEAFQALERIDATFGNTFNSRECSSLQNPRHAGVFSTGSPLVNEGLLTANSSTSALPTSPTSPTSPRALSTTAISHPNINYWPSLRFPGNADHTKRHVALPTTQSFTMPNLNDCSRNLSPRICSPSTHPVAGPSVSVESDQINVSGPGAGSRSQAADLTPDQCLILVQCSSEDKVVDLVKKCLFSADLKPLQQAQDLNVSDSAIQAFLLGDVFSVEPSSRRKLLEWIIGQCHHTEWFTQEMAKLLYFQGYGDGLDVHFTPRRERFTFRERHLDVLEAFWKKKQYPTFEEKEQIANDCNYAMALEVQRHLDDKEKVTHVNVANWFKNKRKEVKRVTKKGDTGGETVKTFLDRLNPNSAGLTGSMGEHLCEYTVLRERLLGQESLSLSNTVSHEAAGMVVPSNPDSSSASNTTPGFSSKEDSHKTMQIVFPSYSNLASSYPVNESTLSKACASTSSEINATSAAAKSSQSQKSQDLVSFSPDSSSTTQSLKISDAPSTVSEDNTAITGKATLPNLGISDLSSQNDPNTVQNSTNFSAELELSLKQELLKIKV